MRDVKIDDRASEASAEFRDIKGGDRPNAALACDDVLPGLPGSIAVGSNDSQSGDYDATRQRVLLGVFQKRKGPRQTFRLIRGPMDSGGCKLNVSPDSW